MSILASPEELYVDHLRGIFEQWSRLRSRFTAQCDRSLGISGSDKFVLEMLTYHDLGKLTEQWQIRIRDEKKRKPPHAPIGAAYLYKTHNEGVREPLAFATLIHHTDVGVVTEGLEKPDVLLVRRGVIDSAGRIRWAKNLGSLSRTYFQEDVFNLRLDDLTDMARGLRLWFRGTSVTEMHGRRLQASLFHHILRICDVRAASQRKEFRDPTQYPFVEGILRGGIVC